jgi:hypothetical protein
VQADHSCDQESEVDTDVHDENAIADPVPVHAAARRVVLAPLHVNSDVDMVAAAPAAMSAGTSRRKADNEKRPRNSDGAGTSDALDLTQAERRADKAARRASRAADRP